MMNHMPADEPFPFRQFILKLHSRCNLACDHCYVYTMTDQRWRGRPRTMSRSVVEQSAVRVAEHVRAHRLRDVEVVLHGGEPLLAGHAALDHVISTFRTTVNANVRMTIQTNATLLDDEFLDIFRTNDVGVGVSLDGDASANDRHRVWPDGRGSFADVREALHALASTPSFRGLLCTIDLANDPVATYEALLEFAPPTVDFLLPHGNRVTPPPGVAPGATRYADWLITVFDRWYAAPVRQVGVRLFDELLNVLLGGHSRAEGLGLAPAAMVVVETDGAIEQSDVLAAAFEGAAATGLHVDTDSFDDALRLPAVRARQSGYAGLCASCRACDLAVYCGGGLRAHRYGGGGFAGFDHPSVYCADLYKLITHVRGTLVGDLAALR